MIRRFIAALERLASAIEQDSQLAALEYSRKIRAEAVAEREVAESKALSERQIAVMELGANAQAEQLQRVKQEIAENERFREEQRIHMLQCEERFQARVRGEEPDVVKH